jgi:hypothetical protein
MLVRQQFNVTELAAAGKQADLETERLRLKALAAKSVASSSRRARGLRRRHRRSLKQ